MKRISVWCSARIAAARGITVALMALAVVGFLLASSVALWGAGQAVTDRAAPAVIGPTVAANGVVEGARPDVALRPELAGIIAAVHVRENDEVRAGQLLVELRNASYRCQVALTQAELVSARAQYEQVEADWQRSQRLIGTRSISREQYDSDHYKRQIAQARVQEMEARLGLAQAELAKTQLRAPAAGRILQVYAEPGEAVAPTSALPILRLADLSRRRVRAFVEELDVARVRPGQRASVSADGFPGEQFAGTVTMQLPRMGRRAPESDAPGEYKDMYFREVLIDLEAGSELPVNLRVQVFIAAGAPALR